MFHPATPALTSSVASESVPDDFSVNEHAPWPMAAIEGAQHIVRHVNLAFCRLLDRPAESLAGRLCHEVMPVSEEWLVVLDRVFQKGRTESHVEPQRADCPVLFRASTLWPMMSGGRCSGVMIQVSDPITEHETMVALNEALILGAVRQNELAEEAEHSRAEAEAANQAKDRFLAVLSHELRTPLTPILMAVRMLSRHKALPAPVAEILTMIQRNVEFEAELIDEMLDFTSISRGKLILAQGEIDLRAVLQHAQDAVAAGIGEKRQHLTLTLDGEHGVFGDRRRLLQVFANLLKNASKFTPEGGDIYLRSRCTAGSVTVEVSDTGVGFAAEASERIFEAFIQASDAVTREYGGLGLGLAISQAIVEAHGGTLRASSPGPGQGATFTVELPRLAAVRDSGRT